MSTSQEPTAAADSSLPEPVRDAILEAIRKAGGPTTLARELNARGHKIGGHQTVHQWTLNGVPADYCPDIEHLTGVLCERLRPKTNWALVREAAIKHAQQQGAV